MLITHVPAGDRPSSSPGVGRNVGNKHVFSLPRCPTCYSYPYTYLHGYKNGRSHLYSPVSESCPRGKSSTAPFCSDRVFRSGWTLEWRVMSHEMTGKRLIHTSTLRGRASTIRSSPERMPNSQHGHRSDICRNPCWEHYQKWVA